MDARSRTLEGVAVQDDFDADLASMTPEDQRKEESEAKEIDDMGPSTKSLHNEALLDRWASLKSKSDHLNRTKNLADT